MKDCLVGKRPDIDAPSFTLPKSEQEMILIRFLAPIGKILPFLEDRPCKAPC